MMRTTGTVACERCGTEFHITGILHQTIDADGMHVSELEPDRVDVEAMRAHACQARWEPCPGGCGDYYCTQHDMHAYDCPCPVLEDLIGSGIDPYAYHPQAPPVGQGVGEAPALPVAPDA